MFIYLFIFNSNCSIVASGSSFSGSCVLLTYFHYCEFFLKRIPLAFQHYKTLRLTLYISCPCPTINDFPKTLVSFIIGRSLLKSKIWLLGMLLLVDGHCFRLSQNTAIYTSVYINHEYITYNVSSQYITHVMITMSSYRCL